MSSAAASPREGGGKKVMEKVLIKMKTALHIRGSSSRRAQPSVAPEPAPAPVPVPSPAAAVPVPPPASQSHAVPVTKAPEYEGATRMPRIQVHEERMKKLGARFGLEIKPSEWHSSEGEVLRVDKPVRMRIHRECHECRSRFGASNVCQTCRHPRCSQCTRYPDHRTDAERQANREKREALLQKHRDMAPILPSYDYSAPEITLTRPRKTGGQDLVYKGRARMRVRRYCHVCESLINSHGKQARTCEQCGHKRCDDCPRQPNDKKVYPYGYPNDEPGPEFKRVFACHECRTKFDSQAADGTQCPKCTHEKCPQCPRVKPRKVKPNPDPQVLESIQAFLAELQTPDRIEVEPERSA